MVGTAMAEEVDLDDAVKAELLELEQKLETVDLFTLLGVPPDSDAAAVKAAFFALCRRVHPDRHFRKKLGTFKSRIDTVFRALSKAHQTLIDPVKREAYLVANPTLRKPKPPPPKPVPKVVRGRMMMWNKADLQLPPFDAPPKKDK